MINKACRGPSISIRRGPRELIMPEGFRPAEEGVEALEGAKLGKGESYNLEDDLRERKEPFAGKPESVAELKQSMVQCFHEGRSRPQLAEPGSSNTMRSTLGTRKHIASRGFTSFQPRPPRMGPPIGEAIRLQVLILLGAVVVGPLSAAGAEPPRLPNIILIVADDLGYAELGCYGQKRIKTPHIDRLAREGMRFTQHYCGNAVCAPSRCSLMTGKHPGHAYIRSNRSATLPKELKEKYGLVFSGQEPIPEDEVTIAEVLRRKGSATAAVGKWGLGHVGTTGAPNRQGFDLFFGYNCQGHAHSYYPGHLWRNSEKVLLNNNPPVPGHARLPPGADPDDPASYEPFKGKDYAPDRIIEAALEFIRLHQQQPFFLYFPSTLPHVALHVPDEELEPYLGQWEETPFVGNGYTPHRTPRAAYAAMISRLDKDVGRIMALVDELGLDESTLVIFSSDNGTTHLDKEVDYEFFESVGPLRGLKGSLYEGGIRVPMIARWPGRIKPSSTSDHVCAFWDVLPTLAELVGAEPPPGIDGISYAPTLLGRPQQQKQHEYLYWEFPGYGGQQAVRLGRWKGVRQAMLRRTNPDPLRIELYDLESDVGESRDLAKKQPQVVARIRQIMQAEHVPSALFPMPPIDTVRQTSFTAPARQLGHPAAAPLDEFLPDYMEGNLETAITLTPQRDKLGETAFSAGRVLVARPHRYDAPGALFEELRSIFGGAVRIPTFRQVSPGSRTGTVAIRQLEASAGRGIMAGNHLGPVPFRQLSAAEGAAPDALGKTGSLEAAVAICEGPAAAELPEHVHLAATRGPVGRGRQQRSGEPRHAEIARQRRDHRPGVRHAVHPDLQTAPAGEHVRHLPALGAGAARHR